jgi:hypothetical protein
MVSMKYYLFNEIKVGLTISFLSFVTRSCPEDVSVSFLQRDDVSLNKYQLDFFG